MRSLVFLCALALCALPLSGCANDAGQAAMTNNPGSATPDSSNPVQPTKADAPVAQAPAPAVSAVPVDQLVNPDGKIDPGLPSTAAPGAKMPKDGDPIAIITTNRGRIVVKFFPQKAPRHVENFLSLAKKGFYNGTKFHRVIPGFMIQGGDPNTKNGDPSTWGQGGPGYTVKAEFNDIPHTRGILSMARTSDPDSAGSQFFIMHDRYPSLDGQYSVFGQVIEGMDVVDKMVTTPSDPSNNRPNEPQVIEKVEVTKWPVKLKS